MQFRKRSNIPPPAAGETVSSVSAAGTEKSRSTVNSIKLSLDGVTNQFRGMDVSGKGEVYVSCVVFGKMHGEKNCRNSG